MKNLGLPRRPGHRRATATACVLLLPLAAATLSGCTDEDSTATPPVASPAATASGARCATQRLPADGAEPTPAAQRPSGAYTVDDGKKSVPHGMTLSATGGGESALLVSGSGQASTRDKGITKSGATPSLAASRSQGLNAAALVHDGGGASLFGGKFDTQGRGAAGVAVSGKGSRADLNGNGISTGGSSAHGLLATRSGTIGLTNVQVVTAGAQSAPVVAGPDGGKVTVSGGTMTSAGCGSPGVLTSGEVSLSGTLFDLANSEAFTVEPGGSLSLKNARASSAAGGVVLRGAGETSFTMAGGAVQTADSDVFRVDRSTAKVTLTHGAEAKTKRGALLRVRDGGTLTFTADHEKLKGDTVVSDGSARLTLRGSSTLQGTITGASLQLAPGTAWSVGGDSSLKGLGLGSDAKVADVIRGNGYTVTYDKGASPALHGRTYELSGGGTLKPA